jgi:hypothetical protein
VLRFELRRARLLDGRPLLVQTFRAHAVRCRGVETLL